MFKGLLILLPIALMGCATTENQSPTPQDDPAHIVHSEHKHQHAKNCGHEAVTHDDHQDYLHNNHRHAGHDQHIDEHGYRTFSRSTASASDKNKDPHHKNHKHTHGEKCGHKKVKHEKHFDYIHDGHYHHVHGEHADEHGLVGKN